MRLETIAFPLFLAGILAAAWHFRAPLASMFRDRENLREWIRSSGSLGPLAFVGLQFLQVVVFVIPGEVTQVSGGFVFGFWAGAALSVAGIALGSLANYGIGRALGRPFVQAVMSPEMFGKAERTLAGRGASTGYFLLFLVPGIPKDILCYFAGMARAPAPAFLAISIAARLPGIIGSTLMGTVAYTGNAVLVSVILAVSAVLFVVGVTWRKPLEAFVSRIFRERRE